MNSPDYKTAIACLRENLATMTGFGGVVSEESRVLYNVSNALLVICDALQSIEERLKHVAP